jgi:gamma-glutamylcyclotransferase (GGCT)/AIG2-like uncharacterized protein YtfP
MDGMSRNLLFEYGNSKRGYERDYVLKEAEYLGEAFLDGFSLLSTGRGYPCIVPGKGRVRGEVFALSPENIERMDELMSCPALFRRERRGPATPWPDRVCL